GGGAVRERDDAAAAYAAERERMRALAAEALPLVRLAAVDGPVVAELEALAAPGGGGVPKLSAMAEESARLLGVLDRLSALCDEDGTGTLAPLGAGVDAELRARVARRATWGGGPGGRAAGGGLGRFGADPGCDMSARWNGCGAGLLLEWACRGGSSSGEVHNAAIGASLGSARHGGRVRAQRARGGGHRPPGGRGRYA